MSKHPQLLVRDFNQAIKAPADRELRIKLIQEEAEEFIEAVRAQDVVACIDAVCDLLYVVYGAADVLELGLLDTLFYENLNGTDRVDWTAIGYELEDFNHSVNGAITALRSGDTVTTKTELEDLAQGLWQCGAEGLGVKITPFFHEVHRTNMHKLSGPRREDGKQLKPEGWKPPRIRTLYARLVSQQVMVCPGHGESNGAVTNNHPEGGEFCQMCGGLLVQ